MKTIKLKDIDKYPKIKNAIYFHINYKLTCKYIFENGRSWDDWLEFHKTNKYQNSKIGIIEFGNIKNKQLIDEIFKYWICKESVNKNGEFVLLNNGKTLCHTFKL